MMNRAVACALLLLPLACDKKPDAAAGSAPASAAASAAASVAAPTAPGALTLERLTKASALVKEGDDWKAATETLLRELGPATHTGNERQVWGVASADECSFLMVTESSDKVSEIKAPATYPRSTPLAFEDCYLYLDRTPPDKDSAAPGPEEGKVYSVREAMDGINNARSKWIGKKVRVRGRTLSVVRSGPTAEPTLASMNVADEKDDTIRIGVQIRENVKGAPQDGQKVVVTSEGTVASMGRALDDAKIVK